MTFYSSIGKPGPFQIIKGDMPGRIDHPVTPPRRRYLCKNYSLCLDLAGVLNWDNFTCRGCCGEVDESLLWKARQVLRKDRSLKRLFSLPQVKTYTSPSQRDISNQDPTIKEGLK
ncbi:MAG: hypothetical protein D6808_06005 [Candidatus Dadabacteria bacterium]|nr:MAG: hypothetical protein D6808_06005 [Candidatus Dadabacteria bacterium]